MQILITGGAGFIGSHLTDALLANGHDVLVYDNLRTGSLSNLDTAQRNPRFRFIQGDVLDPKSLREACGNFSPDAFVHLAALVSVQDARNSPDENFRLNVAGTHAALTAALETKIPRIIFASSAAVYGDNANVPLLESELPAPIGLYGGAKAASELLLAAAARDYGLQCVCLRFFNVFGPRQRPDSPYSGVISIFADKIRKGLPVTIYGDGSQTRDFVPVREITGAIAAVMHSPNKNSGSFNVCTGQRTSLKELVRLLGEAAGRPVSVSYAPARTGDIIHSGGNPNLLQATFHYRPQPNLLEALRELLVTG